MSVVMAIPDLHCPCDHRDALRFALKVYREEKPTHIVFLGDVIDHNAISFHDKFPELPDAQTEFTLMKRRLRRWHNAFPKAKVCIGNHDERVHRVVRKSGVPGTIYLKEYNELFGTHGWEWAYSHTIDGVLYTHGTGSSTAWNIAKNTNKSTVSGHIHTEAEIKTMATDHLLFWGMNCGCLIDRHHPAMQYAKCDIKKPILAIGIVRNGEPKLRFMNL